MQNIQILLLSIVLEGFPYIVIGALISAVLEVFIPSDFLRKIAGKNNFKNILFFALLGFVLPICECGIVPVVRRLRKKGVPTGPMMAYLLSAPAFQPIVFFSTFSAFNNNLTIALIRCIGSLFIAVSISYFLRNIQCEVIDEKKECCHSHHSHDSKKSRILLFCEVFFKDCAMILAYLTIGGLVSALISYYNPVNFYKLQINGFFSIIILMIMAVILSICSEADAFVAYSFPLPPFTLPAKMAFLWLGPLLDIKLIVMYSNTFNKKFVLKIFSTIIVIVLLMSLIYLVLY